MPYSLRKRAGKRIANANSKSPSPDTGAENSSGDSKQQLTKDLQDEQPLLQNDLSATAQPPVRKLRSSKDPSTTTSPSQSLLDRFQRREPKTSVKTAKTHTTYKVGKDTAFSEHFDDSSPRMSSEWIDVPGTPEVGSDEDIKVCDGVKFEMMGKKGQAAEAPNADKDDEAFVYERRATRSQSRRQQRADSADSNDDAKALMKESNLVPPALTFKKINEMEASRTPSPNSAAGNDARSPAQIAPTPANSPSTSATLPTPTTLVVDRTKGKAEYRLSTTPHSVDSDKTITHCVGRKLPQPPANSDFAPIPTPVIPPIYNINIRPEHIWTSPLASSSRPEYPWGWMKKWSCCRCSHLDPSGRNRPSETMVEQKVCSRLRCQHVRCGMGCRMLRDFKFDNASSFMSP
jgi:hypothetical protein